MAPKEFKALLRIGPHNIDVLSLLFGSLLGDTFGEKRKTSDGNVSVRFALAQSNKNIEDLVSTHQYLSSRGYCSSKKPKLYKKIGKKNKVYYGIRITTYSFGSLVWLHDIFYQNQIKSIPDDMYLERYLTPLALRA